MVASPTITLREISAEDLPTLNSWRNAPEVIEHLGSNFLYIGEEIDTRWYENYIKNLSQSVRLSIIDEEDGTYIGNVNLTQIHGINRSAEFSIMIGNKDYWGKGIGQIATKHMLNHGFNDINMHRIYLFVLEENDRAISLYEKVGFKKEGLLKDSVYKNGKFHSMWSMAILSSWFNNDQA